MKLARAKIFLLTLVSFICGIALAGFLPSAPEWFLLFTVCCFLISVVIFIPRHLKIFALIILCFSAACLGIYQYQKQVKLLQNEAVQFSGANDVAVSGVICSDLEQTGTTVSYDLCLDGIYKDIWQAARGRVAIMTFMGPAIATGDRVKVTGKYTLFDQIRANRIIGRISYAEIEIVAARSGLKSWLPKLRDYFNVLAKRILPEPQASLLLGLLFGIRSGFSKELLDQFSVTGTAHIIAISGFNITILVEVLRRYVWGLGPKKATWLMLVVILFFVLLVGGASSVVRAAIMGAILVVGRAIGRKRQMVVAIIFAAALMLAINPLILNYDLGFQLSFAATLGLIYLSPIFDNVFKRTPKVIREPLVATLAAQIFSLPILVTAFGQISLVAPLTNLLIIPLIAYVMAVGAVVLAVGAICLWLGVIAGWILYLMLDYMLIVINFFAQIPFASLVTARFDSSYYIIYYGALIIFLFEYYQRKTPFSVKHRRAGKAL